MYAIELDGELRGDISWVPWLWTPNRGHRETNSAVTKLAGAVTPIFQPPPSDPSTPSWMPMACGAAIAFAGFIVGNLCNRHTCQENLPMEKNRVNGERIKKSQKKAEQAHEKGFDEKRKEHKNVLEIPPLDFSPAQDLVAKDLHDTRWTFRHIFRGQPKRHLLTTGWSVFLSTKRLFAGDSVLFVRDEKSQLMLGIRRANRQAPTLGILAAAGHANANSCPFTIFFNPSASPSEFVVPLAKYNKALYAQVSLGMMFETEDCGVRRYMGTISDLDPLQWRNLQVGWDESTAGDRPSRVSIWEIEPVITPFFRPKYPRQPGMPDDEMDIENTFKRAMPWMGEEFGMSDAQCSMFPGLSLVQWMSMQQNNPLSAGAATQLPSALSSYNLPNLSPANSQFNKPNMINHTSQQMQAQPAMVKSQQQEELQMSHQQMQQQGIYNAGSINNGVVAKGSSQMTSFAQELQFQQQLEMHNSGHLLRNQQEQSSLHSLQQTMSQNPQQLQMQQQSLKPNPSQQLQLHLLHKLHQQSVPPVSSSLQPQLSVLQQTQSHQLQQHLSSQNQQPLAHDNNCFSASTFMQPPQIQLSHQPQGKMHNKPLVAAGRSHSGHHNSSNAPRDIETELSSAAISSQPFGIPSIPFKSGCSNEVDGINNSGIMNGGLWPNQTQRLRTYTKVQKRGSVGRSIDVTRYSGYDELRLDLARMFGITSRH